MGQIEQDALENVLYYKIYGIDLPHDFEAGKVYEIEPGIRPDAFIYRPRLTIDTAGFNHMGGMQSYVFNSRLHLADLMIKFYEGYPATLFHTALSDTGDAATVYVKTKLLLSDGSDNEVVCCGSIPHFTGKLSPLISYPDNRALSMEIGIRHNGYEYRHTFPLVSIGNESRASYMEPELKDIDITTWDKTAITGTDDDGNGDALPFYTETVNISKRFGNLMRVSETDNPFFFPAELSYSISGGSITGIASTTAALSQGQYGEFPLYVFTDEGIWAMQVGDGNVCYSRATPLNRESIQPQGCMTTIENAIIYRSGNSLYMLSGAKTSEVLALDEYPETAFDNCLATLIAGLPAAASDDGTLLEFFAGAVSAGYNRQRRELVFCNGSAPYMLVLQPESKHLYRVALPYRRVVNGFNTLLAQGADGRVYDLCDETPGQTTVTLVTRPWSVAADTYARLREVVWRMQGTCSNLVVEIAASHEPEEAALLLHKATCNGTIAGHLGIRQAAPPYKYYRLLLNGNVGSDFHIDCADIAALVCENNRLR